MSATIEVEPSVASRVLNALPHPVFVVGPGGRFVHVNDAAEGFFHASGPVLKSRELGWYLGTSSPLRTLIDQVRRQRNPVSEYRVELSSPRLGGDLWVDIYAAPEGDGDVVVLLQVRSMAETMDRQLTHRGAARSVTGLAAMLGHEIKNPLAGIRGAAQLLDASGSEDDRALTRLITEETDRIVRLVDRMEVFSDERPIERDPVNVHSVLEQVKSAAVSGFGKAVQFVELYDPSLPPVWGDRDQLVQVFINLVKNACEAMAGQENATLSLETAFRPGMRVSAPGSQERISLPIALTVSDNGPGIPDEMHTYMFDPFITTKPNGSGLGLALVAKIVGDHGGVISCESNSERTTFRVLMPMWSEQQGQGRSDHG